MKIAVVTSSFLPNVGGAEFAVHYLAQEWSALGHSVVIFNHVTDEATHPEARYRARRYRLPPGSTRFGLHSRWTTYFANRHLGALLGDFAPDAISVHFAYPVGIWLSRLRPVPRFTVTPHGPALNETPQGPRQRYGIDAIVAASINAASHAIAISSHARDVMTRIGVDPSRIADIPNGAEVARFARVVEGFDLRRELRIPDDAIVVLSVGRETWAKDYRTGLEAFAAAVAQSPNLYYLLLGKGIGNAWTSLASDLGVAARVRFHDGLFGDQLVAAYQQSQIFFLPSCKELCPLVVPEAMAAGLPAVVTNVSGSQDMVVPNRNGFLAEPRDVAGLADGLVRLAADDALRARMGADSRERSARHDWGRIAAEYLDLMAPYGQG